MRKKSLNKKLYVRQLSQTDRDVLLSFKANDKLSINQVAHFNNWNAQNLSALINSPQGMSFPNGLDNLPPDALNEYKICANLIADLIPQYIETK